MKQTAVEWLESNLPTAFKDLTINKQLIEQAKEMEKQQGYSEEEVIAFGEFIFKHTLLAHSKGVKNLFEQFKNK
jgi:hypothetical protein